MAIIPNKITPFLWFDTKAEEAANFYVSLFNSNPGRHIPAKITATSRYDDAGASASGRPKGSVMVVSYELEGQEFTALNGGPLLKFSGAISFMINCKTQDEVDFFWEKLGEGGETGQCGWINRDRYGVTWQIVPSVLAELIGDADEKKSGRVMKAMLQMTKIDIAELQRAYSG